MGVLLKYLASFLLHLMWARAGNKGPVPPVRLPKRGPVNLPPLGPWQVMIAMWLLRQIWKRIGGDVKSHLMTRDNGIANRVGAYLPWDAPAPQTAPSASPATVNVPSNAPSQMAQPSLATHDTKPLPTRRLPRFSSPLKSGSILSKLRGASGGSQGAPQSG